MKRKGFALLLLAALLMPCLALAANETSVGPGYQITVQAKTLKETNGTAFEKRTIRAAL